MEKFGLFRGYLALNYAAFGLKTLKLVGNPGTTDSNINNSVQFLTWLITNSTDKHGIIKYFTCTDVMQTVWLYVKTVTHQWPFTTHFTFINLTKPFSHVIINFRATKTWFVHSAKPRFCTLLSLAHLMPTNYSDSFLTSVQITKRNKTSSMQRLPSNNTAWIC